MKGRLPVPIDELARRMPRAGKILCGKKQGKSMTKITEWRFRSPHRDVIETLAIQYGGQCVAFHDDTANPKDQWEVFTLAPEIEVIVVPGGLSQGYEMWSKGGRTRTCDGRTVVIPVKDGPDDYRLDEKPCLCASEGERQCKPTTRISVVLPSVAFRGSWTLETHSDNAMLEMPGMVDLIDALGGGGMVRARLAIESRQKVVAGMTRHFIVPVLSLGASMNELQAGMATVTAIANPTRAALCVATPAALEAGSPADDVYDAEIVDDDLLDLEAKLREAGTFYRLPPDEFAEALKRSVKGDRARLRNALARMSNDEIAPVGIENGRVKWRT